MASRDVVEKPDRAVERNILLTGEITRYFLKNPSILESLPEKFELVILPEDDPELLHYNLHLLMELGSEGKPVVFVRMQTSYPESADQPKLDLYVPLAA